MHVFIIIHTYILTLYLGYIRIVQNADVKFSLFLYILLQLLKELGELSLIGTQIYLHLIFLYTYIHNIIILSVVGQPRQIIFHK